MNDKYKINDSRDISSFKKETFSGFKKTDVLNTVIKSIEAKKIEQSCFWTTESIVSGYTLILWEKLINYAFKVININNPELPYFIMKKNKILYNQINRLDKKDNNLLLRNSQMIRNLFFDMVTTLCTSLKTKRYDKYLNINEKEDFNFENITKRLCAEMNILPPHIIKFDDPNELKVIINEIYTLLKNKQFGYERSCFWIMWLIKWEGIHKKRKEEWIITERNIKEVPKKLRSNIIWVIWEIIFEEVKNRRDDNILKQVDALFDIYTTNYTLGKRVSRIPVIFNAVGLLTNDVIFNIPVRSNYDIFIQTQCKVNKMFLQVKKNEKVETKTIPNTLKKKEEPKIEIIKDKINIFNELDIININN